MKVLPLSEVKMKLSELVEEISSRDEGFLGEQVPNYISSGLRCHGGGCT